MSRVNPIFGTIVATTMLVAACSASPAASGPGASASPLIATPAPTATTAAPSAAVQVLAAGGQGAVPGTYRTAFEPPLLTLTIDREVVKLNCDPSAQCFGGIDANKAGWLDLEFGAANGSEIDVIRLDKVYDPTAPASVIDPPSDLAAWLEALPGTAVLDPPKAVEIGGLPATEFDVKTPGEMQFGPMADPADGQAGIGPSAVRISLVIVAGHLVIISEWLGPENTARNAQAALDSLQPLVDSIVWG